MKYVFAFLLMIGAAQDAHALKKASREELSKLNKIFETIRSLGELMDENRAKANLKDLNEKTDLDREYKDLKEQREAPCRQALWLTIKAYGILPFDGDRPILPNGVSSYRSPEMGTIITWVPVFEEKILYDLQNAAGNIAFRNVDLPTSAGNTASDGVSRIFPEAFTSPAALASLIYHERIHFKQFTSPRSTKTPAELEIAAYSAQRKVWEKNLFGMTSDELDIEDEYLQENLAIQEAKAVIQRAEVKKAKGLPTDDFSIVSHSEDEIARLIQQAKNQLVLGQRDHDERLQRNQWVALARRACDIPGSVSQSELDALPRLHNKEPLDVVMLFGNCYERVYYRLHAGESAEAIAREARPVGVAEPPRPLPPVADAVAQRTFESVFANLQFFAEMACKYGGHFPTPGENLLTPRGGYTRKHGDDETVARIAAGLGRCQGHVFRSLYEMLREGRGNQITKEWFIGTVARTPAPPSNPPPGGGQVSPPVGGGYVAPPKGTNPCQVGDDPFACQRKHPKL